MDEHELAYSIKLLDKLVDEGYDHQLDCMYGAAIACYKLKKYHDARGRCESILRNFPEHAATTELHLAVLDVIDEQQKKKTQDMVKGGGLALVGTALAVAGGILLSGGGSKK